MRFTNRTNLLSAEEQRKRNLAMHRPPHVATGDRDVSLVQAGTTINPVKLVLPEERSNRK